MSSYIFITMRTLGCDFNSPLEQIHIVLSKMVGVFGQHAALKLYCLSIMCSMSFTYVLVPSIGSLR